MGMNRQVDLVIVGAGAAGLGAARRAQELGLSFLCLEAMDRIGGRAHTDTTTFGMPWDRGCHWLHSGSVNVFAKLADQYGITYETGQPRRRSHNGDQWLSGEEQEEAERVAYIDMRGAIEAAGKAGRDVSAAEIVDMNHRWIAVLRTGLAGEWGVDIPEVSTADDAARASRSNSTRRSPGSPGTDPVWWWTPPQVRSTHARP